MWQDFSDCCMSRFAHYGVCSAKLLAADRDCESVYRIAFGCGASRLRPDKLVLIYRRDTNELSWPRMPVPAELASLGVGKRAWTKIWDETKIAAEEAERLSAKKKLSSDRRRDETASWKVFRMQEEDSSLSRQIEHEWRDLLDYATDRLFMYNISVTLKSVVSDRVYSGLVLRFRPIVPAVEGDDTVRPIIPSVVGTDTVRPINPSVVGTDTAATVRGDAVSIAPTTLATAIPVTLPEGTCTESQCQSEMSVVSSYCGSLSSAASAPRMQT